MSESRSPIPTDESPVRLCPQCGGLPIYNADGRYSMVLQKIDEGYWWVCPVCHKKERPALDAILQFEGAPRLPGF